MRRTNRVVLTGGDVAMTTLKSTNNRTRRVGFPEAPAQVIILCRGLVVGALGFFLLGGNATQNQSVSCEAAANNRFVAGIRSTAGVSDRSLGRSRVSWHLGNVSYFLCVASSWYTPNQPVNIAVPDDGATQYRDHCKAALGVGAMTKLFSARSYPS